MMTFRVTVWLLGGSRWALDGHDWGSEIDSSRLEIICG